MAHFAKLGTGNIVEQVIVVSNDIAITEQAGVDFINTIFTIQEMFGNKLHTIITIRKNFAGVGYQYDQERDAFIAPKPFNSWILNEDTCRWEALVAKPDDGQEYKWNETNQSWDLIK
jgi:hypothetical protein